MGKRSTIFSVNHDPSCPCTRSCRSALRNSRFGPCSGTRHFVEVFARQTRRSRKTLGVGSKPRNQRAPCHRRPGSKGEKHHIHKSKSFECVRKDIVRVPRSPSHAFTEYYVDGKSIPSVNFDVGPSWSGLIPVSNAANETRKVQS